MLLFLKSKKQKNKIIISDNPINRLTDINGTDKTDLDEVIDIVALNISGNNTITTAFNDLPAVEQIVAGLW